MAIILDSNQLTLETNSLRRIRYFAINLVLAGMQPGMTYTPYVGGSDVSAFCKPFGGVLGDPLVIDTSGKLNVCLFIGIPYNQKYLSRSASSNNQPVSSSQMIQFTSTRGDVATTYLPILVQGS